MTYYPYTNEYYARPTSVFERNWDPDRPCFGRHSHRGTPFNGTESSEETDEEYQQVLWDERIKITRENHGEVQYIFPKASRIYEGHEYIRLNHDLQICNPAVSFISDHRGSNHCKLDFSQVFEEVWTLAAGVYLVSKILESFWRVKCNKFENHYECIFRFSDDEQLFEDQGNPSHSQNTINNIKLFGCRWRIKLLVDYGS